MTEEDREVSSKDVKTTTNDVNNVKKIAKPPELRKTFILENIGIMDILAISTEMGVHERTIYRDIDELKASGEWDKWIENELLRLHRKPTISDVTKYKELSKLRARSITQKTEVKAEGDLEFVLKTWRPEKEKDEDA